MNLPNKLTVLRVILVPFFVAALMLDCIPHNYLIAGLIFGIASYTDHLDGKIARRDNLITDFGKFMDPLADKILVMAAMICFVALGHTNPYFVIIIMFREFAVTSIRLVAASNGTVIAANIWGKFKTVSQIVAIIVVIVLQYVLQLGFFPEQAGLFHIIGEVFNGFCTLMALISGIIYIKDNWSCIADFK
ncbi:MAG: CDP-diacylglycerol--glycerol-3-phosphate 3-phosphatidyltransferase [Clostridia bacterium]|nr:CDP-diacylglycerol--glycerol-3-phosphate 3-phosphatidyltransferase [Clostridia bacterium]